MSAIPDSVTPPPAKPSAPDPTAAAQIVLAVLAFAAALTYLGPVLQPFLVAVFLFYAMRFGVKTLAKLGMSPWTASAALIGIILIASILLAQLVYRESAIFQKNWPRYEVRITAVLNEWMPTPPVSPGTESEKFGGNNSPPDPSDMGNRNSPEIAPPRAASQTGQSPESPGLESETKTEPDKVVDPQLAESVPPDPSAQTDTAVDPTSEFPPQPGRTPEVPVRKEPPSRQPLTNLFQVSAQDVINYVFSHSLDVVELITMAFFYLIFLFLGSRKLEGRMLRAFPGERGERLLAIGQGISESMERFMVVKTVVGLGMGFTAAVVMYFLKVEHWLLWAFIFFASNYITYIGSIAACVPPIVMAFLGNGISAESILAALLIVLNRTFWIDFVEIKMSGRQLNLDPTLLFLWLSYWGWSWGVLGLILAYPMMAAVKISLWHLGDTRGWAVLLSDE